MKTFTKSVLMLAVVAAFVSFASCGNAGAQKAAEDSIAAAKAAAQGRRTEPWQTRITLSRRG